MPWLSNIRFGRWLRYQRLLWMRAWVDHRVYVRSVAALSTGGAVSILGAYSTYLAAEHLKAPGLSLLWLKAGAIGAIVSCGLWWFLSLSFIVATTRQTSNPEKGSSPSMHGRTTREFARLTEEIHKRFGPDKVTVSRRTFLSLVYTDIMGTSYQSTFDVYPRDPWHAMPRDPWRAVAAKRVTAPLFLGMGFAVDMRRITGASVLSLCSVPPALTSLSKMQVDQGKLAVGKP
jgi:hypothetical protein